MRKQNIILAILLLFVGSSSINNQYPTPFSETKIVTELDEFLCVIAEKESGNNYDVVNTKGYLGKYQFGMTTIRGLGYNVSRSHFLADTNLQEEIMLALLNHNRELLKRYINRWDGRKHRGKVITESGILAAAHLAGPTNVIKFFKDGADFKDGYGTRLSSYLYKFSGYELNLDNTNIL
jgi:hypothetical protein